ncbi:MAG: hypothetical protein WKF91_20770 [Segetibacter sp.]
MKVQQSNQLINPFGGIQFVLKQIKEHGIDTNLLNKINHVFLIL